MSHVDRIVQISPIQGVVVDRSGEITEGGVSQVLMEANPDRVYFFLQNASNNDLWYDFGVDAVERSPSIKVSPNGNYENPSHFSFTQEIRIVGPVTGQVYTCKEG